MNEPATANPPSDPRLKTLEGELSALTQQVQFLRAADSKKQTATACVALSLSSLLSRATLTKPRSSRDGNFLPPTPAARRSIFAFVSERQQRRRAQAGGIAIFRRA